MDPLSPGYGSASAAIAYGIVAVLVVQELLTAYTGQSDVRETAHGNAIRGLERRLTTVVAPPLVAVLFVILVRLYNAI